MTVQVLPKTRSGRRAVWSAAGFAAWFPFQVLIAEVERLPRSVLIVVGLAWLAAGLAAGILAMVALLRDRERAVLVYLALVPGLFVVAFLLGEILFPH